MSDAGVNTSSEITTKDLKEGSYGGGGEWIEAPAIGKANQKIREMEADNEVEEEEEKCGEQEEEEEEEGYGEEVDEMKMRRLRQLQANGQLKMMRMTLLNQEAED